ncbi:MAG: hypothetical protein M5U27_14095 [Gaiella sp.]|nr:hypothetical protein [Gaiella sp.]
MVRPDRRDVELGEPLRGGAGTDTAGGLRLVVEGQEGDDRQRRDATHRLDRDHELVEVEERLDHEEVDATALEHLCLLGIEWAVLGGVEDLELAEGADRAGDEDVATSNLSRLAGEPDAGRVELLERAVEQHAGQLAPVGAEGVRLDQLCPGRDVARVDGDDALRGAEVRLLGAAEPVHRLRDERAHPSVGDERRAGTKAVEKTAQGPATVVPKRR